MPINPDLLKTLRNPSDPMHGYGVLMAVVFNPALESSLTRGRTKVKQDKYSIREYRYCFGVHAKGINKAIYSFSKKELGIPKAKQLAMDVVKMLKRGHTEEEVCQTLGIQKPKDAPYIADNSESYKEPEFKRCCFCGNKTTILKFKGLNIC
jgi:hypothetical protein